MSVLADTRTSMKCTAEWEDGEKREREMTETRMSNTLHRLHIGVYSSVFASGEIQPVGTEGLGL